MTPEPDASTQERALMARLGAEREMRAAAWASDQKATAAARALWSGPRRVLAPAYLRYVARHTATRGRVVPLGTLPWDPTLDAPVWRHSHFVGGVPRLALTADVPTRVGWRVALDRPAAMCGWLALRSEAWEVFVSPLELSIRMVGDDGGAVVAQRSVRVHPYARAIDRRWVPFRIELPGGTGRIELETSCPEESVDRAWLVVGDPVLDLNVEPRRRRGAHRRRERRSAGAPDIALLMPVHDPPLDLLNATLESVERQTDTVWQLSIVDDGSRDAAVVERLQRAGRDPRVILQRHEVAGGISAATNSALRVATAPYVATLDHDDLLHPRAIELVRARLAADPTLDVLYSDNDLVAADGTTFSAALKPDWSPDLLRSVMYTLHLGVYRRELVERIGGWRSEFDGAQDHDLVLRLSEHTDRIGHLPRVLAHWRAHAGSAALGELAKPLAYERGRAAVAEHLHRTGQRGDVERLPWAGRYRVRRQRTSSTTVILPDGGSERVSSAWRAVLRAGDDVATPRTVGAVDADRVVVICEAAAVPASPGALDELVAEVEAGAGAAGGLVVDSDGRVLAGGVAFPAGLPVGLHLGADARSDERHPSLTVVSNRQAVRGVVALRGAELHDVLAHPAGVIRATADLAERGERVVWNPHARFESVGGGAAYWLTTDVAAVLAADRGDRRDPFWNPQRRPDLNDESYDQALHEERA
jgi:hypothetical protein